MSLSADILLDRIKLKQSLRRWKSISILVLVLLLLSIGANVAPPDTIPIGRDFVARIAIEGMIEDDRIRLEKLAEIAENPRIRAVLVYVDSPGGTVVGGESLYDAFNRLKTKKPVVVLMRTVAASAGYMVALPADQIFAMKGTITGSIGVIAQSPELVDLGEKLGVKFNYVRSSPLKAAPAPFEKMTPEMEAALKDVVDNFFDVFVGMVKESRKLNPTQIAAIANGKAYTGVQAKELGLIDAIGGEEEALAWLTKEKRISSDIEVHDVKLNQEMPPLPFMVEGKTSDWLETAAVKGLLTMFGINTLNKKDIFYHGLLSVR